MTKKDDLAGPMIGWSLGTGMDEKAVTELLDLPCIFNFKVIGEATPTYQSELISMLEEKLGRSLKPDEIECRHSAAQKYLSITFKLYMSELEEIHAIYAVLRSHGLTRFVL